MDEYGTCKYNYTATDLNVIIQNCILLKSRRVISKKQKRTNSFIVPGRVLQRVVECMGNVIIRWGFILDPEISFYIFYQ